ncbi:MAG TPA: FHA domain-containing protein [Caulifigura sp.]|nr:FHA domain-containing protein [Caulifigura sp.]
MNQHDAASLAVDAPWIEIRGGRTRFPKRPITGQRLLIGSGSGCHLQLGGGIPMAHSIIRRTHSGWSIEALVADPWLIVAGQHVRQAALNDGDVIEIGPFTLVAHLKAAKEEALLAPIDIPAVLAADRSESLAAALNDVTAEELVDRLVTELTTAAINEHGPGAAAELMEESALAESAAIDEEQLVSEVMVQLAELTAQLAARGAALEAVAAALGESGLDESVLSLPVRDADTDAAPLRKSA